MHLTQAHLICWKLNNKRGFCWIFILLNSFHILTLAVVFDNFRVRIPAWLSIYLESFPEQDKAVFRCGIRKMAPLTMAKTEGHKTESVVYETSQG